MIVHSSSVKELLEISILEGKPERQESRKNGAFKIFHTFNSCGPTPFLFPLSCMLHKSLLSLASYILDDPLNLGLYNMIYFSIIKTLKKLTLYNKLKQVSIFIYSTWYIYLFHMTTNLHANSLVGHCAYLNLEVIFMNCFLKKDWISKTLDF